MIMCFLVDRDDEKPTVVVMREGDLTEQEANVEEECLKILEDEKKVEEGKISFKKPTKREKEKDDSKDSEEPKKKKEKSSKNKIQKKCLLSFDEEDEDS